MLPRRACKTSPFLQNANGFPKGWYQFAPASAVCVSLLIPLFCSGLSFDHCLAESLPYPWKCGLGAPLLYFFSTYAHLIMTLVIPCCMHVTDVKRCCSDPQLLSLWTHCSASAEATYPSGCSQSRTEHSEGTNPGSLLLHTGLLWWVTWAQRLPSDPAHPFLELHCSAKLFLPTPPSFPQPCTDVRPVMQSESSPHLLWFPPFVLHRHFLQEISYMSNPILVSTS